MQKLQQKLTADSATIAGFFRKLQEVVETPLRQNAILHSIRYPRMYDRFDNVEPAHRKTFEWLLQGPTDHLDSEQQAHNNIENHASDFSGQDLTTMKDQAKYQKHKEFVHWLQKGIDISGTEDDNTPRKESIYHIAGKPGAGKSTLMKFLCENQTTIDHLKTWAGEKRLICAKAFFWRWGEEEQKNITGLRNCLLHQILTIAPDLIPIAFPSVWESDYRDLTYVPTDSAFNALLKDSRVFEKCKMVLFIDGLDEYQGRPIELIKKIIGWTAGHSANLKICLSSREWNEFEVGFKDCPRLRIQEWTRDDIQVFVQDNFKDIGDLSTSISKGDLNTIADVIVDKAQGVFLWVRVVLAAIEQGVLNGDDLQDLQKKTNAFPVELRDLYQHLFDSIPEYDRQKAFEILSFSHDHSFQDRPLLQYKFLSDLAKNPDFAMDMYTQPLSDAEVRKFINNTSRRINGLCKGFLEIFTPKKEYYTGDEHVRLMHSTAAEFLDTKRDILESYIGGIDIFDLTCQSFLALAKSIDTEGFYTTDSKNVWDSSFQDHCPFISMIERIIDVFSQQWFRGKTKKERFLAFLENIDRVAVLRYQERRPTIPLGAELVTRKLRKVSFINNCRTEALPNQVVMVLAARSLLIQSFDSGGLYELHTLVSDSEAKEQIMRAIISGVSEYPESRRSLRMLAMLFEAGVSPQLHFKLLHPRLNNPTTFQLWSWIFTRMIFAETAWERTAWLNMDPGDNGEGEGGQYKLIELFLRYGAGEDLCLMFGPCFEVIGANRLIVQVSVCQSEGTPIYIYGLNGICVDYQLDIVRHARTKGGVLNFRDVLAYCFPRDAYRLNALLDGEKSISPTSDNVDTMPVLFPTENTYFEDKSSDKSMHYVSDYNRPPKHCKQCLEHSEKCFTDFEAKFKDEKLGRPYKPKHPSTCKDEDLED